MNNSGFVVPMVVLALLGSGCARTDPHDQSPIRSGTTLDGNFIKLAGQIPGFGGMFFDEDGVLNVYMKAAEEQLNARALRQLQVRVVTAIKDVMGRHFFEQARGPRGDPAKKPKQAEEIRIIKGQFDVLQLVAWRKSLDKMLSVPGVIFIDLNEQQNRLTVGIEASTARRSIEAHVNNLGVPQEALIIEVAKPFRLHATLRGKRRPVSGGFQIEADVGVFAFKTCTIGFNAIRNRRSGFVTNSHCTETQGVSNDTDFHQPDDPLFSERNKIGDEDADPPFFTGGDCPPGRRCRFSDSAFIDYRVSRGQDIARTTNDNGSTTLDDANPTIKIVSETAGPTMGIVLNKMGRTTGWTFGTVTMTCANIQAFDAAGDTGITKLCQDVVTEGNTPSRAGDSGSPVFGLLADDNEASLYGILWGGNGTSFAFSNMEFIEQELGPLRTTFPPPTCKGAGAVCQLGAECCAGLACLPSGLGGLKTCQN